MNAERRAKGLEIAGKHWVTENVANLFYAEIANEGDGGICPATLSSTIDSVSQAADIMCESWDNHDFAALLMIVDLCGRKCGVREILRAAEKYTPPTP